MTSKFLRGIVALAIGIASTAALAGHGHRERMEEYRAGDCKVAKKWEGGTFKEWRRCGSGPSRLVRERRGRGSAPATLAIPAPSISIPVPPLPIKPPPLPIP